MGRFMDRSDAGVAAGVAGLGCLYVVVVVAFYALVVAACIAGGVWVLRAMDVIQ